MKHYIYPNGVPGLMEVRGRIESSCFIVGKTGSGKSTLLRMFNGLIPDFYGGEFSGKVRVFSGNPSPKTAYMVHQNPYEQITGLKVIEELVFPSIQSGKSFNEARKDAMALAEEFRIDHLLERPTYQLSLGELQIVQILAGIGAGRKVLLLDEPFAHLSRRNAFKLIKILNDTFCVVSDHRIELMKHFPEVIDLGIEHPEGGSVESEIGDAVFEGEILLKENEIVAITGDNGAGKTMMLKRMAEEMRRQKLDFGISLQNPNYSLTERTVFEEIRDERTIREFQLQMLKERHPHSLSYGQAKRVSIAKAFRHRIVLLDEPTAGQDVAFRDRLLNILRRNRKTAVIATHDENLAEKCDRVIEL